MLTRKPNWQTELNAYVTSIDRRLRDGESLDYGKLDCCTFVFDFIERITGFDIMSDFRGKYGTKAGAIRALKRYGSGTLRETVTRLLGDPVGRHMACAGDVAWRSQEDALGLVISSGNRLLAAFLSDGALSIYPAKECDLFWKY